MRLLLKTNSQAIFLLNCLEVEKEVVLTCSCHLQQTFEVLQCSEQTLNTSAHGVML